MGEETVGLTVVSFLWYGDRWTKDDMGPEYVRRLKRGVERNLTIPHKFVCITNVPGDIKEIESIPLYPPSWRGCLPRLVMYDPNMEFRGQILAIDIDVVVTGSLDDIGSYDGEFCVRSKFAPRMEHKADGDIIGFRAGFGAKEIWEPFVKDPSAAEQSTGGRERYWYRQRMKKIDRWQELYPNQIFSYKRHVRGHGLPKNARLVSCHGRPRPHQINEPWIKEHWI